LVFEQSPFNAGWWSFKKNAACVRYEVAVNIQNGWIVWINGPFPAGLYSDCRITVECGLLDNLQPDEKIIVDRGYPGHNDIFVWPGGPNALYAQMKRDSRACHETINQLFKEWSILNNHFRYAVEKHGMVLGLFQILFSYALNKVPEGPLWCTMMIPYFKST